MHASVCVAHCLLPKRGLLSVPIYFHESIFRRDSWWWVRFSEWFQDCAHCEPPEAFNVLRCESPHFLESLPNDSSLRKSSLAACSVIREPLFRGGLVAESEQRPSVSHRGDRWRGGRLDKSGASSSHLLSCQSELSPTYFLISSYSSRRK